MKVNVLPVILLFTVGDWIFLQKGKSANVATVRLYLFICYKLVQVACLGEGVAESM